MKETLHAHVVTSIRYNRGKGTEKMDVELTGEALERHNEIAKQTIHFCSRALAIRKAPRILVRTHFSSEWREKEACYVVLRYIKNSDNRFCFCKISKNVWSMYAIHAIRYITLHPHDPLPVFFIFVFLLSALLSCRVNDCVSWVVWNYKRWKCTSTNDSKIKAILINATKANKQFIAILVPRLSWFVGRFVE